MQDENYNMPPGDDFGDGGDAPEAPKKHKLSFGHPKEQAPDLSGITNDINSLGRRLRLVEEASANMRNMVQITEENMISKNRVMNTEIKTLASEINDIKKDIHDVKDKVFLIIKELQNAAKKEDVKLLEKYINMWNPVRFVTKGELDYVVDESLDRAMAKYAKAPAEGKQVGESSSVKQAK